MKISEQGFEMLKYKRNDAGINFFFVFTEWLSEKSNYILNELRLRKSRKEGGTKRK